MSDNAIIREYDEHYQDAYDCWNPYFPLADRDLRYYLGDQWDTKEKEQLFEQGRNAYVFNLIRRNINLLSGYQKKHRLSSVVLPIEGTDQLAADQATRLILHSMNYGDYYRHSSDAFVGGIITAFNLLNVWMDYRDDPVNGDIKFSRDPFCGFITDPYFTKLDFSDCSYVIKRKYLSAEQAASLLPGQEKDIYTLAKYGMEKDDKFTWLPYQRQPDEGNFVSYNEYYRQGWEMVPAILDQETGEYTIWEGPEDALKYFVQNYPQLKILKKPKQYVECHIIVNDQFMRTEKNQYGLNEYPFVPVVAQFMPESDNWGLKMQSLVRCQIDPQKEANRRRSQMIDILDSNINSGWIAKKSAVVNPRSLFQSSQGKVIWKQDNAEPGDIEKIPPAGIHQSMFELQRQFDQDIMTILGINDANFGMTENAQESGLMMMLRQGASIVNLQDVMDNFRYAQKLVSKKILKLSQTWTPEKIRRILNEEPSPQLFDNNFVKYDISVQEGVLTDTQQQMYFKQLVDLYQITGGPQSSVVTPSMLAKAAPLQGKTEFNKEIEQNQKAQAEQAKQQSQIQQQILASQMEYNKASSINKIAGAKEHFTRSVANMGLEDSRAADAIDSRASAALDKAKAMKELESMEDDRLLKYMQIISMMEEMGRIKEEQVKEDDVKISARGEQAVEPQLPQFPMEGEQLTQPSEV